MRSLRYLACLLVAGCAVYQPKPLEPAQLAQRFEQRTMSSVELRTFVEQQAGRPAQAWPLPSWNRENLTLAALYYSPALAVARSQAEVARAGVASADVSPNPSLQFPFEYTTNYDGAARPVTTGPSFDIPIETAGKRAHRTDQAAYLAEAARFQLAAEAWKVRSQVRDAFLAVYVEGRRSSLLAEKAEQLRQVSEMLAKRQELGEVGALETSRSDLAWRQAQTKLAAAQRSLSDAQARLAAAIGIPGRELAGLRLDWAEFESQLAIAPAAPVQREAIFRRADLRAALYDYEASQAALQLEIAKQYPDIHLGLGYAYDAGAHKISFGLASLSLPLFDRNQGPIAQAQARREEMAARAAAVQDAAIGDFAHAVAGIDAGRQAQALSSARLASAQRQLNGQSAAFAAGAADRLNLTQAKADFLGVRLDDLNEWLQMRQAAYSLEDAMQQALPTSTAPTLTHHE